MGCCVWQCQIFWKKKIVLPPKIGFYEFSGNFGRQYLLILFYNKNLCYLLCSSTDPIFEKMFVSEIWAEMFLANQIARFFNQPYLHNKSVK